MIDLSNNNGAVNFQRLFAAGQRRCYLKCTEGKTFVDRTYAPLRERAVKAGLKVGGYHFAHPQSNSPRVEAEFFLHHLGPLHFLKDLRPCLDLEHGTPTKAIGTWAIEFCAIIEKKIGVRPLFYSFPSYIEGLHLAKAPGPLWLASFGRNDGVEHAFRVPRPWRELAAHQYSSNARVAGATGRVDISHVYDYHGVSLR